MFTLLFNFISHCETKSDFEEKKKEKNHSLIANYDLLSYHVPLANI